MSNDRKPIARITFRKDKQTYSLISIWPGKFPGTYSISRDKGTDKRPPIALFDALKAWGGGRRLPGRVDRIGARLQRPGWRLRPSIAEQFSAK